MNSVQLQETKINIQKLAMLLHTYDTFPKK